MCTLQNESEIKFLTSKLSCMQTQLNQLQSLTENTQTTLQNLRQENELLASELKKQNQYSRSLSRRLEDERYCYQKKKEYFLKETSNKVQNSLSPHVCCDHTDDNSFASHYESEISKLTHKVQELEHSLEKQSKESYELCNKFLRMKYTRDQMTEKYNELQREYLKVLQETMLQLDETRREVNLHADTRFQRPIHPSSALFLQVIQRNSRLMHENSQLRLENQKLKFMLQNNTSKDRHVNQVKKKPVNKYHSSGALQQTSCKSSERLHILRRYKGRAPDQIDVNDAATTTAESTPFVSETTAVNHHHHPSPPSHLPDAAPARTVSAPEIIQTSRFLAKRRHVALVEMKESATNT